MPTLSVRLDVAIRVCVCSAAASLFADAIGPSGHGEVASHAASVVGAIGSAFLLSVLFACVWDPLKERIARGVLGSHHPHGELIGLPALALMVVLGAGLVWVHTILHHRIEAQLGESVGTGLERGLIVAVVCAFWFSPVTAVWLRAAVAVLLVVVIGLLGQALFAAGITHEGWTDSEILWTITPCAFLLWVERCFRPWDAASHPAGGPVGRRDWGGHHRIDGGGPSARPRRAAAITVAV